MNGTLLRLGGRLVAVGWAVVCVLMVSVQVIRSSSGSAIAGPLVDPVQVGAQTLRVGMSSWAVGADGGTTTVTVDAPPGWQSSSDQGWLTVTFVDGGVTLTASANAGALRTATVVVTGGGGVAAVEVAQEGRQGGADADAELTADPTVPVPAASSPPGSGPGAVAPPDSPAAPNPTSTLVGQFDIVRYDDNNKTVVVSGSLRDTAQPNQVVSYEIDVVRGGAQVFSGSGPADLSLGGDVGNHGFYHVITDAPDQVCVTAYTDYAHRSLGCKNVPTDGIALPPAPPPA